MTTYSNTPDLPTGNEPVLGNGRYAAFTGIEPQVGGQVLAQLNDLLVLLRDMDHPDVRWMAARDLGRLGDPRALEDLLIVLHSGDVRLRRYAAWAVGKIGEGNREAAALAVPGLLDALARPGGRLREVTAWALGRIGHVRAVPALREALRDSNSLVRRAAAEALGRTGAIMETETMRNQIIVGLEKVLDDSDRNVRRAAIEALGRMGDAEAVPGLFDALTHQDRDTRWAAAWALGQCGERARARLIIGLGDPDPMMREAAAWGLRWLDSARGQMTRPINR